jgi:hypothetical protein
MVAGRKLSRCEFFNFFSSLIALRLVCSIRSEFKYAVCENRITDDSKVRLNIYVVVVVTGKCSLWKCQFRGRGGTRCW